MARIWLGIVLLVAICSPTLQDGTEEPTISFEEFSKVVFSPSLDSKQEGLAELMKFGPIRQAFPKEGTGIDKTTYVRLVVGMLTQVNDLPTEESVQKMLSDPAPLEGVETNQDAYINWYIHKVADSFVEMKNKDTFNIRDVYEDVFSGGIHDFFSKVQEEEQANADALKNSQPDL